MGMVDKGVIVSIEGPIDTKGNKTIVRVHPSSREEIVTHALTIPWYFRGDTGALKIGDEVAYVTFEDNTGILISRMDGNWTGIFNGDVILEVGGNEDGNFKCANINCTSVVSEGDVTAGGISLETHIHGYEKTKYTDPPE